MRLWHKDLLCVLPQDILIQQFEDCCKIYEKLDSNSVHSLNEWALPILYGSSNQEYSNKMTFAVYWAYVFQHLDKDSRLKVSRGSLCMYHRCVDTYIESGKEFEYNKIYDWWMGDRFKNQDLYELQRMYDLRQISEKDWIVITAVYPELR